MTGRACAQTWRPYPAWSSILLLLGIACASSTMRCSTARCSSLQYYIVDTIILLIIGTLGYSYTRTNQMVTQYHWLYETGFAAQLEAKTELSGIHRFAPFSVNRRDKRRKIGKVAFLR